MSLERKPTEETDFCLVTTEALMVEGAKILGLDCLPKASFLRELP